MKPGDGKFFNICLVCQRTGTVRQVLERAWPLGGPVGPSSAESNFQTFGGYLEGLTFTRCLHYRSRRCVCTVQADSVTCRIRRTLLLGISFQQFNCIFPKEKYAQTHFFLFNPNTFPTSAHLTLTPVCSKPCLFLLFCSKPSLGKFCILLWRYFFFQIWQCP